MPVPASDAIASDVGHGALGVRYDLRPFRDLLSETVGQRHLWVELRPRKVFATWTSEGSGVYSKAVSETWDGIVLDVVGVQTLTETLTRVAAGAAVAAGQFAYGTDGTLWIHLTGDANPSGTTVVAQLGIHLGSHGIYQPILLPDRLTNGNLEAWTGADPDGWTITASVTGGTITLDKTASDPLQGSYAARFTATAATGYRRIHQDFATLVSGAAYRLGGAYRNTCTTNDLQLRFWVWDTASAYVQPDGRTTGADPSFLASEVSGAGEWKRFAFDFICPSWATTRVMLGIAAPSGQTGTVDFDDVKLQPISRHAYHEPLLSIGSLPTIEAARADSFWGPMSSALGSLSLLNGGGRLEPLLAAYDWLGARMIVRVGGRYQLGGNEILMDDCPVIG